MRVILGVIAAFFMLGAASMFSAWLSEIYNVEDAVYDYIGHFSAAGDSWLVAAIYEPYFYIGLFLFSLIHISAPTVVAGVISGKPKLFASLIGFMWIFIIFITTVTQHHSDGESLVVIAVMLFLGIAALVSFFTAISISNKCMKYIPALRTFIRRA
jgi:hypothetical protein